MSVYLEITDPFESDSDAPPAWSGEFPESGLIKTGRDALESGVYPALDENGGAYVILFTDDNTAVFADPWEVHNMTR